MIYIPRFLRSLAFVTALGLSVIGCGGGGGGGNGAGITNPHTTLFSKVTDDEPGLLDGDFPVLYGLFSNNTNNATGYVEMATISSTLAPYERVSGFKIVGDRLYLRVEVADPGKASGLTNSGGKKTPDYIGLVDGGNRVGIRDFAGMGIYVDEEITPAQAFEHAGFYFNTPSLPAGPLDPAKTPLRVTNIFDPNNPINQSVSRVNYGSMQRPVQVSLPTGVANVDLFIEGSNADRIIDFDPTTTDRQTLEGLQKHPAYDPSILKAVILTRPTRCGVDIELFSSD